MLPRLKQVEEAKGALEKIQKSVVTHVGSSMSGTGLVKLRKVVGNRYVSLEYDPKECRIFSLGRAESLIGCEPDQSCILRLIW